jgi:hypothetical protein
MEAYANKTKLNTDEILKAEYNYIANTVFQATKRRASLPFISLRSVRL